MVDDFKRMSIASADAGRHYSRSGDVSGNRASTRSALALLAQIRFDGEHNAREVRVRNLSEGGLMIELDRLVAVGTIIWLDIDGIGEISGKVAWCTQGRAGIALDAPIDPAKAHKQDD